ncbi:hypothetical protein [Salinimicrobium sp. TH3]|uniref:hypothetical protein n=1 Tax=Salinimicrobium sp. TH3 TaxID=2997342 RepID=UPI0022767BDE|nr:hypothetical protein [Salinimicrobium sp. TH3]MCY2685872.1 hypothetical protein [Salinimicrobium sp. TH3]
MNSLEIYRFLFQNPEFEWFYHETETKKLEFPEDNNLEVFLDDIGISVEIIQNKIAFEKYQLPFTFFNSVVEFNKEIKATAFDNDIVVHKINDNDFLWYDHEEKKSKVNGEVASDTFLMQNAESYFRLLNFFKAEARKEADDIFSLVDFFSESNRSFVLTAFAEKKRLVIRYPQRGLPDLNEMKNISTDVQDFLDLYESNDQFPIFLKNSLIDKCYNISGDKLSCICHQLKEVVQEAKLNFNVYLHGISLEKIKAEYKEYKNKYYSGQNEVLNKISGQILALPLSVAASAFAINRLNDSETGISLVLTGLFIFTVYISYLIHIYWKDLISTKVQMDYDFSLLSSQSFFEEHVEELEHFKDIKIKLHDRIKRLSSGLRIYSFSIWFLNILLCIYGLNFIFPSATVTQNLMLFLGLMLIFACVDTYLIFSEDSKSL